MDFNLQPKHNLSENGNVTEMYSFYLEDQNIIKTINISFEKNECKQ